MTTELNATQARAALVRERLPEHLDRLGWSTERIAAHQRDALRRLLRIAIDHSPFHAARLHGVEPERFELSDLVSLPIMTKAEMIAAYDDAPNGLDARALESLLTNALREAGLEQPEVDVNATEPSALTRHPETGKTRRFIPLPT